MNRTVALVLAAGKGTRMQSSMIKVLHPLAGQPMLFHILDSLGSISSIQPLVVLGHQAEAVRHALTLANRFPTIALQEQQLGTGHAVSIALPVVAMGTRDVLIVPGDTPLLQTSTLASLRQEHRDSGAVITLLSCLVDNPSGYGRIIRDDSGAPLAITEHKELPEHQWAIREINAAVYCIDAAWLRAALPHLPRHGDGEYYLPDLVAAAHQQELRVQVICLPNAVDVLGVNDRVQLADAEAIVRGRINQRLMRSGVTMQDPIATYIDVGVDVGADTTILAGTVLSGSTTIGMGCTIGPASTIHASRIGAHCRIERSVVEEADIADAVVIGPFAHIRPGTQLAADVHIGNFAEIKNSSLGSGTKQHHMSYLGDATVGERVNIAAGTITANFDGVAKHRTVIGNDAFIGCDTILRAPITIGEGARTGAGAVVTHDVPPHRTVIGMPARPLSGQTERGEGTHADKLADF